MEDKFGLLFMVYCLWKVMVRLEALQSLHEIFGKRVGMELSCRIAKKLEKQQGTHRCGVDALWFIALSGFREFNRSFNHSKIMHCALKIMY